MPLVVPAKAGVYNRLSFRYIHAATAQPLTKTIDVGRSLLNAVLNGCGKIRSGL
ncbi:hypothetical protein Turpa_0716 [Turneriella parva DSM 21527]|uniref:Uncharacterized protein n=1 Tax=Turneriella parva (strain ATCC BAA-1111 / DSM 21527 / NCTC 11395 / H) TaxID=869212 RepID=I4B260_TURPD|nr:hypothetical protein Turpa_0716 [Turneriella parva DSM 21527]